jgi:hypothetical protein
LEARYNYEDQRTGSVWVGYNFSAGNNLVFEITPFAPGALMPLTYKKFAISSENEYVINTDDRTANFFYTWSEFGYLPIKWLRVGLVGQRTRAYQTIPANTADWADTWPRNAHVADVDVQTPTKSSSGKFRRIGPVKRSRQKPKSGALARREAAAPQRVKAASWTCCLFGSGGEHLEETKIAVSRA